MSRSIRWIVTASALLLAACMADNAGDVVQPEAVFDINDGDHGAMTVPGFFFLSPTVKKAPKNFQGTFDPNILSDGLDLKIEICKNIAVAMPGFAACVEASPDNPEILKTLSGASPPEIIRVDAGKENYSVTWQSTDDPPFVAGMTYRAIASVGDAVLGWVDMVAAAKQKDLKGIDPNEFAGFVVGSSFVFKFRIETGIPGAVVVTPATATIADANTIPFPTQDFTATVTDLHGVALPGVMVQWATSSGLAVIVSPTGPTDASGMTTTTATANGTVLSPTNVTITATSQGAMGTATLTIEPSARAPTAVPDGYSTDRDVTLTVADGVGDLLDNDDLGIPDAGVLDFFGGGSLGGAVTDNAAGSTVGCGGTCSLTVNADGSFTYIPDTGFTGQFTFDYRLTNSQGSSSPATVTIDVEAAPTAVPDTYMTNINTDLNVSDGPGDLLDNDDLGFPFATLTSFGGGSLGGAVTDNAAGASVALAGGTLTVNADGSLSLTSPTTEGDYTFDYRITNTKDISDATVMIQVKKGPVAVDDGPYEVGINTTLNVGAGAGPPDGLLVNDMLGVPAATLTSFGGGSLGGAVTDNAAGASVALAGGTLTVGADGSFDLVNPTTTGPFTFLYRITNAVSSSDATVTINVVVPPAAPTAVADAPAATSAPGDDFHTALNAMLTSGVSENLMANDDRGSPLATVVSFGGGDLGGAVTDNAAGATATFGAGSLTVNGDGSFVFTPDTDFVGLFTFDYRIQNTEGMSVATVTLAVGVRPDAMPDGRNVLGNVSINTVGTFSVLTNDLGDQITITAADATSTNGGTVLVNTATGEFSYNPPAGLRGSDTFGYTIMNGFGSVSGTVTLTIGDMIWFIDNTASAPASNGGRLTDPFNTLAAFEAVNGNGGGNDPAANDAVLLYSGSGDYTGGVTLENNQFLIGQGASESIIAITGFTEPPGSATLPSTGGSRPTIVDASSHGITLGSGNTIRGLDVGNTTSGFGITDDGGTVGGLTISEVSLNSGRTGGGFRAANGGTLAVTLDVLEASSSTHQGILIGGLTPGSSSFTVSAGSISTTGVRAVDITGAATLTLGVTLTSVSANGGTNGIVLNTTAGSFTVTGDGANARNGSGGTIQNMTAAGIALTSAQNVSLSRMNVTNPLTNGILGSNVTNFTLDYSNVTNNGNAVDEGGIRFANNLLGTSAITNSVIGGSAEHNVEIINTSGTLTLLTVGNSTFEDTNLSGLGADGFLIETRSTASATVSVSSSTFEDNATQGLQGSATDNSSLDVTVTGSTFNNNNEGLVLSTSLGGDLTFDVSTNSGGGAGFTNHNGTSIFVGTSSSATAASIITGEIDGNVITAGASAVNHPVFILPAGDSDATIRVSNNTINNAGLFRGLNVSVAPDNPGDAATVDLTVTGNTVTNSNASASHAMLVEARNAGTTCAKIEGNVASTANVLAFGIRFRERDASVVSLEQGGSLITDPVTTVLTNNNTATVDVTGAPAVVANGTCTTVP